MGREIFGKKDSKATIDVAGKDELGIPEVHKADDPNDGLSDEQMRNRKIVKIAGRGLEGALQPQAATVKLSGTQIPLPGVPEYPQDDGSSYLDAYVKKKRTPFFGQGY